MFLSRVFGEEGEGNEGKDKPWSREQGDPACVAQVGTVPTSAADLLNPHTATPSGS